MRPATLNIHEPEARWISDDTNYDDDWEWRYRAVCRDADGELFFPEGGGKASRAATREAKRLCLHCPVRTTCLEYALRRGLDYGTWGGMSATERKKLTKALAAQQEGASP